MKSKQELISYLISGGITTGVNYLLYAGLLAIQLPCLAANSIAWAGAVLTAYILNRCCVFHSRQPIAGELMSFSAMRFITLVIENILLCLLVSKLHIPAFPSKILVSTVTVIGNFVLCKFRIFKEEVIRHG